MGFFVAEWNASQLAGLCEHCMAIGQARKGSCIERREGMKRVAVNLCSLCRCKYKIVVESCVVSHQHGTFAIVCFDRFADWAKDLAKAFSLGNGLPFRIPRVNAREVQCGLLKIGAFERVNLLQMRFGAV